MKMNITSIISMIAAVVLVIIVLSSPVGLAPILNIILKVILIVTIYLLIRAGGYRDEDSKVYSDLDSRISGLKESLDRIEKKVDKIDGILEKVSQCSKNAMPGRSRSFALAIHRSPASLRISLELV